MTRRMTLLLALGACEDQPISTETLAFPVLGEEVVIISDAPIAGGAATAKVEFAPVSTATAPADEQAGHYHAEAQIRYSGALLGGRNKGDFVPYVSVELSLTNRDTGAEYTLDLLPTVGAAEGWHYAADADLHKALGASEAGYDVRLTIHPAVDVVVHSDLLDSLQGTFLGSEDILVSGYFTLDDLTTPAEGKAASKEKAKPKPKTPGGGYGY